MPERTPRGGAGCVPPRRRSRRRPTVRRCVPPGTPLVALLVAALAGCGGNGRNERVATAPADPAEVAVGERLFLETRFAQRARAQLQRDVNARLPLRDPVMDETVTTGEPLPGPFRGATMNCRACHLVDEQADAPGGGNRTYADFARRSPLPAREDGLATTARNSPALVDATQARSGPFFLHFDGEFVSLPELARATLTGRNFGWLADEQSTAVAWIARVIREDDGRGTLAADFASLPYSVLLAGTDAAVPGSLRLPPSLQLDVEHAGDDAVLDEITRLIGAYVDSLRFARDVDGRFAGSAFDRFLLKNGLPQLPDPGESELTYSRRLRDAVDALAHPRFVSPADGELTTHHHAFVFAARELAGLEIFLAEPASRPLSEDAVSAGGIGNCIACHQAPVFSDFRFHNNGAAQDEYDALHGAGTFAALHVPELAERDADPARFLPPSAAHPDALGLFRSVPDVDRPELTDLGVWNVFANDAVPLVQPSLLATLCDPATVTDCTPPALLPRTIALFKTPSLRDLGHSGPYLHTGELDTLEDVVGFYGRLADLARAGSVRNADPELATIALTPADRDALVAFLRALDEDYE
jgi:hypothetical protein